jgi:hypothetical protein
LDIASMSLGGGPYSWPVQQSFIMAHVNEQTQLYINCMQEIRDRINVVESVGQQRLTTGLEECDKDLVFLQFRKVLELVAFASLTANK